MKWEEAQIFNEAISFAVFLDSCTPSRDAPLSALHKRFHTIWKRHLEAQPSLQMPSLGSYTPQIYESLIHSL